MLPVLVFDPLLLRSNGLLRERQVHLDGRLALSKHKLLAPSSGCAMFPPADNSLLIFAARPPASPADLKGKRASIG